MRDDLFIGLPAEFSPPEKAADHLAALDTLAEREAYFLRIPEGWRPFIVDFAKLAIGHRIVEMPTKLERQNALASVPEAWREDVKWHVLRLWNTRELRAEYQADRARKRAAEREGNQQGRRIL